MALQLSFLFFLVAIAVASTRFIYIEAVNRHLLRLGRHCRILAALIVATTIYAGSIGFSVHEHCMTLLRQSVEREVASEQRAVDTEELYSRSIGRESVTLSHQ